VDDIYEACSTYHRDAKYTETEEGKRTLKEPMLRHEDNINPLNADLNPICHFLTL